MHIMDTSLVVCCILININIAPSRAQTLLNPSKYMARMHVSIKNKKSSDNAMVHKIENHGIVQQVELHMYISSLNALHQCSSREHC